jgi:hypothetical protein
MQMPVPPEIPVNAGYNPFAGEKGTLHRHHLLTGLRMPGLRDGKSCTGDLKKNRLKAR